MSVRVHPARAPEASVALGYLLVSTVSALALAVAVVFTPELGPGLLPLVLVHLVAVGVGVSTLLGVGRHLALTLFAGGRAKRRAFPLVHAVAVALFLGGFLAGAFPLVAMGGGLLFAEVLFVAAELAGAFRARSQFGAVHAFLAVAFLVLLATMGLGIRFAIALSGYAPPPLISLLLLHVALGTSGAFALAVMGTSLQLVPMFSAARPLPAGLYFGFFFLAVALEALTWALAAWAHPYAWAPFLFLTLAWLGLLWDRLRRGRPKANEPFFLFARLGELSLVATAVLLAAGVPLGTCEVVFFLGFLLPTLLAYLSRIVPFLLWLRLTQIYGYERTIPKVDAYLPSWLGMLVSPYALGLIFAAHGQALAPRLLLGLSVAVFSLGLLRGFYVGFRWVPAPESPSIHSASRFL